MINILEGTEIRERIVQTQLFSTKWNPDPTAKCAGSYWIFLTQMSDTTP